MSFKFGWHKSVQNCVHTLLNHTSRRNIRNLIKENLLWATTKSIFLVPLWERNAQPKLSQHRKTTAYLKLFTNDRRKHQSGAVTESHVGRKKYSLKMFGVARRTRGAHNLLGANMRKRAFDTCTEEVGSTILRAKTLTEVSLNNVRRNKRCS